MELQLLHSILLLLGFLLLFRLTKKSHSPKLNLPPGPWKLPIIGSIHHVLNMLPHHAFHRLSQQHGPVMLVSLGQVDTLVISSSESAKEIMKTHDLNFSSRPDIYVPRKLLYGRRGIGFAPYGDYWRQLRKIAIVELMSAKRVRSFHSLFQDEISKVILDIHKSSRKSNLVNLSVTLLTLMNSIIRRCAFGNKSDSANQTRLILALKEMMKLFSGFSLVDLFPHIKHLDLFTGTRYKVQRLHGHLDEILTGIIKEHELKHSNSMSVDEVENLLDVLLRIRREGELEIPLTDDNLKAVILNFFLAGTDTSSNVVAWGMSELMKNPRTMANATSEVRRVLRGKTRINDIDFGELHYLKLVIKETLRLHPPGPLVTRLCTETCQVSGYYVKSGTRISINAWAIGRDPRYWDDAEQFLPERFSNNPINFKGTYFEYLPFGTGRRMCPGIAFAMTTMEFTLAYLLLNFDWKLPKGMAPEQLDMTESFGLSDARKNDLFLLATPYSLVQKGGDMNPEITATLAPLHR